MVTSILPSMAGDGPAVTTGIKFVATMVADAVGAILMLIFSLEVLVVTIFETFTAVCLEISGLLIWSQFKRWTRRLNFVFVLSIVAKTAGV